MLQNRRNALKTFLAGAVAALVSPLPSLLRAKPAAADGAATAITETAAVAEHPTRPAHHLTNGLFRNTYLEPEAQEKTFGEMMRWRQEAPDVELISFPTATPDIDFLHANRRTPTITWIGHVTLLIQIAGVNILTDPHFTNRASPLPFAGPKRGTPPGLTIDQLPQIDVVLISHNHYDHLDAGSIRQLAAAQPHARYLVPLKLTATLRRFGAQNISEHDWGDAVEIGGVRFTAEPCQHWSQRGLFDRNKTLWASWVVETMRGADASDTGATAPPLRFLFIGDTGYSRDFADLRAKYGGFDAAAIPIGAYEPRWFMQNSHINPQESVQIFRDLGCRFAVATHWGSFILTDEPMDEPPRQLARELEQAGIGSEQFAVFRPGETRELSFLV